MTNIIECLSPVHNDPRPFPKLHQLNFKLCSPTFHLQDIQHVFSIHLLFPSPVDHNAGSLPPLGVHLERVLDVVVRVAVVPHHVRLQLVLQEKCSIVSVGVYNSQGMHYQTLLPRRGLRALKKITVSFHNPTTQRQKVKKEKSFL